MSEFKPSKVGDRKPSLNSRIAATFSRLTLCFWGVTPAGSNLKSLKKSDAGRLFLVYPGNPVDMLITAALIQPAVSMVLPDEWFSYPILGGIFNRLDFIPTGKGAEMKVSTYRRIAELLARRRDIIFFGPAASRLCAEIQMRTNCQMIPILIRGSDKVLPMGEIIPVITPTRAAAGEPVSPLFGSYKEGLSFYADAFDKLKSM